ncbi:MAG: hypothetical protein GXO64_04000 [Candidatus Micrarchaeota archaeon]|nr:hypothetical protein [Candidatus Micrarchaeota archaeon]
MFSKYAPKKNGFTSHTSYLGSLFKGALYTGLMITTLAIACSKDKNNGDGELSSYHEQIENPPQVRHEPLPLPPPPPDDDDQPAELGPGD